MTERIDADICILGAGSGGLTVAAVAGQLGVSTVLIEKHKMGGDCLNYGCVPSKALLAAAHAAAGARGAHRLGIELGSPNINGDGAYGHVASAIAEIAPHDSVERFEGFGAQVILAAARFTGPREVEAGDYTIRARRFVVATGSGPFVPPIPGIGETTHYTNETIFGLDRVPGHLIIVGGGPIGIEMAQAHRQLGAEVTVVEMASILPNDDPELVDILTKHLTDEGIHLLEGFAVEGVREDNSEIEVQCGGGQLVRGTHLLIAAGRRPNLDGLELEKAGVTYTAKGIDVDERLRTTNRRISAIGDVAGGHQFTHIAGYHAGIFIRNALFRMPAKVSNNAYPWVTFTSPELAQVGLTEAAAKAQFADIRVLSWPFSDNDRAVTEGKTIGMVKVITRKGKILGASILGPHAGELIQTWGLAISAGLKIGKIANMIAPYPTFAEINKRAAGEYFTPSLFSDRTRKIVRFLSRFG